MGELPGVKGRIHDICDFRVRMNRVDENVSCSDRMFIEHAIAGNILEIQSLEYILERTDNAEYRGLIQMMITMHTADLEMALEVAEEIGADQTPDLTSISVYPKTPEYDLGMRRMNLVARFLEPLMSGADGSTPTVVPTTGTAMPTGTGTVLPSIPPTTVGTNTAVSTPTGTATSIATGTGTATAANTATGTAISTGTTTAVVTGTGPPSPPVRAQSAR